MKNLFFEVLSWYVCYYKENNNIFVEKNGIEKDVFRYYISLLLVMVVI